MITLKRFRRLEAAVRASGHQEAIDWTENVAPPRDADEFATTIIFVICSSGMAARAAHRIFERCMGALRQAQPVSSVFGHQGKADAIEAIWRDRVDLFAAFQADDDVLAFCAELPFVGIITRFHAAKNLGADFAKPDVHLDRLARREGTTVQRLCARLARQSGYRVATVDTILWRACADGIFNSQRYLDQGWRGSFAVRP